MCIKSHPFYRKPNGLNEKILNYRSLIHLKFVEFYDARLKYQLGELIQVDLNSTQFYLDSVCLLLMEASLDTGGKTVAEIKERNKKTWEEFEKQAK